MGCKKKPTYSREYFENEALDYFDSNEKLYIRTAFISLLASLASALDTSTMFNIWSARLFFVVSIICGILAISSIYSYNNTLNVIEYRKRKYHE